MESLAPFLQGTCTPYNMPVYPSALRIAGHSAPFMPETGHGLPRRRMADFEPVCCIQGQPGCVGAVRIDSDTHRMLTSIPPLPICPKPETMSLRQCGTARWPVAVNSADLWRRFPFG